MYPYLFLAFHWSMCRFLPFPLWFGFCFHWDRYIWLFFTLIQETLRKRRKRTKLIFSFFLLISVQLISSFLQLTTYNLGSEGFGGFFWSSWLHFSIQERDGSLFLKVSKKKIVCLECRGARATTSATLSEKWSQQSNKKDLYVYDGGSNKQNPQWIFWS